MLPRASTARREYALALSLGAAGAGLILLSVRQGWVTVSVPALAPMPASVVTIRGQDLAPLAGALGLVCLSGLVAVVATRRLARRLIGAFLILAGAAAAVAAGAHRSLAGVRAGDLGTAVSWTAAGRVVAASFPWRGLAVLGGLAVMAAGVLVAWRGASWPAMSTRYDRPGGLAPPPGKDPASMWESLNRGVDPTERPRGGPVGQLSS